MNKNDLLVVLAFMAAGFALVKLIKNQQQGASNTTSSSLANRDFIAANPYTDQYLPPSFNASVGTIYL